MHGRLPIPTPLLEPEFGVREEGAGELGMELVGELVEMRILTSGDLERNIWRIGSVQSVNSNPAEQVVGVAVVVGDWPPRFDEGDDGEV